MLPSLRRILYRNGLLVSIHLGHFTASACVTTESLNEMPPKGQERCDYIHKRINWDDEIQTLDRISLLFYNACYGEVVQAGQRAREDFKHKTYSVIKESMEVFLAEGTVTDYVLESYERGYLSLILAMAYLQQKNQQAQAVELNRFYSEESALLYNHGQDPVNALLQADMWDNYPRDGFSSRPFWLWLSRQPKVTPEIRGFARSRVAELDRKKPNPQWQIYALGRFPDLDWSMKFLNNKDGYFTIRPTRRFPKSCIDPYGLLMPTTSWFEKIAVRHHHRYHPLVNAKSWIRLPVGVAYGITTAVTGAGVMVGGCALSASHDSLNSLCRVSIEGGVAIISQSDDVVDATLRPDLRHWQEVPEAVYITSTSGPNKGTCWERAKNLNPRRLL